MDYIPTDRKCFRLTRLKRSGIPKQFIFVDTETLIERETIREQKHVLNLGWVCFMHRSDARERFAESWFEFDSVERFWDLFSENLRNRGTVWLFAHNVCFDFTILAGFENLVRLGFTRSFVFFKAATTIFKFRRNKQTLMILDTMNWYPFSLEHLAGYVGMEKLDCNPLTASRSQVSRYCRNDVDIIKEVVKKHIDFVADNNLGRLGYSNASQALITFRYRFYKNPIYIHNNQKVLTLERESYRGGRCECFFIGKVPFSPVYLLDVNSMYPFVMGSVKLPYQFFHYTKSASLSELTGWLKSYDCIARIICRVENPVVATRLTRLIFPIGRFEVVATTPELIELIRLHAIEEVKDVSIYKRADLFSGYIKFLYRLRLDRKAHEDKTGDWLAKLLANSLYGKFGQLAERWEQTGTCQPGELGIDNIYDHRTGNVSFIRYYASVVEKKIGFQEPFISCPSIASLVTAYARTILTQYIELAGWSNVFYCDTDSMFVNQAGFDRLKEYIDPVKLGRLKVEKVVESLTINAPKDYIADGEIKLKGVTKTSKKITETQFSYLQFPRFATTIRTSQAGFVVVKKQVKKITRDYQKGIVAWDGKVTPFVMEG